MKIAILNVKYSPNLGDGAIAECIEHQMRKRIGNLEIFSLDIGGMEDYASGGSIFGGGLGLMDRLRQMPDWFQRIIKVTLIPLAVERKYGGKWKQKLAHCNALIIGGGHLFMDVDQYFPHRILTAVKQTSGKLPIAVYAVGVSQKWTKRGVNMFKEVFRRGELVQLSVRDEQSQRNFGEHFSEIEPQLSRDPALTAAEVYGEIAKDARKDDSKVIAFGVSDPTSMGRHADAAHGVVCGEVSFYLETLPLLIEKGYRIRLFTNGEDWEYLNKVSSAVEQSLAPNQREKVTTDARPMTPIELVRIIANADALVAHRLHANILSYAYNIPHIGLGWDEKLRSFFRYIRREDYVITSNEDAPRRIAALVETMLAEGIDPKMRQKVLADAHQGLDNLANALNPKG